MFQSNWVEILRRLWRRAIRYDFFSDRYTFYIYIYTNSMHQCMYVCVCLLLAAGRGWRLPLAVLLLLCVYAWWNVKDYRSSAHATTTIKPSIEFHIRLGFVCHLESMHSIVVDDEIKTTTINIYKYSKNNKTPNKTKDLLTRLSHPLQLQLCILYLFIYKDY